MKHYINWFIICVAFAAGWNHSTIILLLIALVYWGSYLYSRVQAKKHQPAEKISHLT